MSHRQRRGGSSPCLTNVWLVSNRMSQPSTIILSMARFFLMFSVSLTSSCIILTKNPEQSSSVLCRYIISYNYSRNVRTLTLTAPPVWTWQIPNSYVPRAHEVCVPAAREEWWYIVESEMPIKQTWHWWPSFAQMTRPHFQKLSKAAFTMIVLLTSVAIRNVTFEHYYLHVVVECRFSGVQ